jgi:heterodisulfide reductase subunit A-like polyferredoxin
VAVVGGGIAGMQAALDLARAGFQVVLIEEGPALGGRMVQLDKTFPTNDCSMCTISPRLVELERHPNIEIHPDSEVLGLEGEPGAFRLRWRRKPRFVDLNRCNGCGDCLDACPVILPSEFEGSVGVRKAIWKPYPQAVPRAMVISKRGEAPCAQACPAGVQVQGYVALAAVGRWAEAYALVRKRNPFVSTCGRICHHPCELACNRAQIDDPVAIRAIKRSAADWCGDRLSGGVHPASPPEAVPDPKKPKIAIVGGGPAGLTAARDLALMGYPVTVFEASDRLGGVLAQAIPEFRLPRIRLEQDLSDILAAGFEVRLGREWGRDFTLDDLRREGFYSVFLATGCPDPVRLTTDPEGGPVPGLHLGGITFGLTFLREVKAGRLRKIPSKVVVIGGGNVAIDAARTALRLGAREVELVCLEAREEMPAYPWEIEAAVEEGIRLSCGWGPANFWGRDGVVEVAEFRRCVRVWDDGGRFSPSFAGEGYRTAAEYVIVAIGQRSRQGIFAAEPVFANGGESLSVDPETLQTQVPWIFAGGDLVTGPRSVVEAVAQGHQAAESIDRFCRGADLREGRTNAKKPAAGLPDRPVVRKRRVPISVRKYCGTGDFGEAEQTLPAPLAEAEASRCLACGDCSGCLACVEACQAQAVIHEMTPEEVEVEVGAVILAPGVEAVDPTSRPEFGFGQFANVLTSIQVERMLSASGPTGGHLRRPSDGASPRRVAWIQCVGSRDLANGEPYCSSVCCMYAVKQALVAVEHDPTLQATIFFNDLRAVGKGFEAFVRRAQATGRITFRLAPVAAVKEKPRTRELVLRVLREDGKPEEEVFDLVVLSLGLRASARGVRLAERLGLRMKPTGFLWTSPEDPVATSRVGVFVAGAFREVVDISEAVTSASAATARVMALLRDAERRPVLSASPVPQISAGLESPRIGVFVCRCGANIARVVSVDELVKHAAGLPAVVYVEDNLYTCSSETQERIKKIIADYGLNRIVVASCSPRTHEPLFRQTLREAGLNPYLFEMANIRDQCSWVHYDCPKAATEKAKSLVRAAVLKAARLRPVREWVVPLTKSVLVIGGGIAGLVAADALAGQGFQVVLVEKTEKLGGLLRKKRFLPGGVDVQVLLGKFMDRVGATDKVEVLAGCVVEGVSGHVGKFRVLLNCGGRRLERVVGAIVVATGAQPYVPTEYGYGAIPRVITQHELEAMLDNGDLPPELKKVVMIQCVGSRNESRPYCSRVCCVQAVTNAILLKERWPDVEVIVLYRHIRTYGSHELAYARARQLGVVFLRLEDGAEPEVIPGVPLRVRFREVNIRRSVEIHADLVVLSVGVEGNPAGAALAQILKVPLDGEGFFLEAHMKLRPVDFASEGIFVAGLAHGPKLVEETLIQALAAAGRVGALLGQEVLVRPGTVAVVEKSRCAACLTCVRVCPFGAVGPSVEGVVQVEPLSCQGCGACVAKCPRRALSLEPFTEEELFAKVRALVQPEWVSFVGGG